MTKTGLFLLLCAGVVLVGAGVSPPKELAGRGWCYDYINKEYYENGEVWFHDEGCMEYKCVQSKIVEKGCPYYSSGK